ncbi:PREDICTED: relaxin-3 isoform X5 [Myotis brandtii]|uniref:relaxin-3 isoform X5 n=1 Tax=Myotis brandtii TaxID=109478 RepID=UPI000703E633|nr:PREDICTED: relaxin-3 isoform X5 [Myotis brandtii]
MRLGLSRGPGGPEGAGAPMRGARGAPCRLLPLLLLLSQRTSVQGSPGPLRCYGVGPLGDLNCSWEPLGDLGAPSTLHLQSQKYIIRYDSCLLSPCHWPETSTGGNQGKEFVMKKRTKE